jgi:hypothetical protein
MAVAAEVRQAQQLLDGVALLERAAGELDEASPTRVELLEFAARELREAPAVRVSVAAQLLGLDAKTVRAWASEGVLHRVETTGHQRLDLGRIHEVWSLVRQLREAGKQRGLLDEVYRRLQDDALLNSPEFNEGWEQYLRGEYEIVRPRVHASSRDDGRGTDDIGEEVRGAAPGRRPVQL